MAIDSHYIPAFSIEDVLLDKDTGAPLSGGLVYFEQDNQRGTLKPVYQITGTSPNYTYTQLPNPVVLSSIGTFEDSMGNPTVPYFYPYDSDLDPEYYYVRVTSSEDVAQFTRQAVPFIPSGGESSVSSAFANELSNPQFSEVFFQSPTVYSFNTVTDEVVGIGPDWDIVVSAAGAATVTLSILTPEGSLNRTTNPGTVLNINSSGVSSLRLRQRLTGSPNLWGSGYLSGTFVAKTYAGTSSTLRLLYSQSNGTVVDQVVSSGTLTADGLYAAHPGSVLIPVSTSTEEFPDAYIDIELDIPLSTEVDITSVMITATGAVSVDNVIYDQISQDRQIDQLFHYYKPQLDAKPIPSYLVGWDFPLNPALANGDGIVAPAVANAYTWDQTILFQSTVSRAATSRANNGAMAVAVTGGATQVALIQYLPQAVVRNMLESRISVNVQGDCNGPGGLVGTVSLWYSTNVSVPVLPLSLITTLDANGHPSAVAAGWTEIPRDTGLGNAEFTLENALASTGFNGWDLVGTGIPNTATYFAIVVGTASISNGTTLTFNSISVVPGDIPTKPAPQTLDQVIQECQYYYEKSYPVNIVPGTASTNGALSADMISTRDTLNNDDIMLSKQLSFRFNTQKRSSSTAVVLYDLAGTANQVTGYLFSGGAQIETTVLPFPANWSGTVGRTGVYYTVANATTLMSFTIAAASSSDAFIRFQYTADARLGVV